MRRRPKFGITTSIVLSTLLDLALFLLWAELRLGRSPRSAAGFRVALGSFFVSSLLVLFRVGRRIAIVSPATSHPTSATRTACHR